MTTTCPLVPLDTWVTAECPARIDISGGWSDTPPITYEHGGAVLNAAIRLDDKVCMLVVAQVLLWIYSQRG